jgi:hypothetical protein
MFEELLKFLFLASEVIIAEFVYIPAFLKERGTSFGLWQE